MRTRPLPTPPDVPIDVQISVVRTIRALVADLRLGILQNQRALDLKYDPNQPRDDWGRWTDGGGSQATRRRDFADWSNTGAETEIGKAPDGTRIIQIGGIPDDKLNWTTQEFMSVYCKGSVRSEMPTQFLDLEISAVMRLANQGNAAARTCLKLLKQDEYRK